MACDEMELLREAYERAKVALEGLLADRADLDRKTGPSFDAACLVEGRVVFERAIASARQLLDELNAALTSARHQERES